MDKASSTSSSDAQDATVAAPRAVAVAVGTLIAQWASIVVAIVVTVVLVVFAVPDGNDLAQVHVQKHVRLGSLQSPKIVFVGGSNLLYGLDSATIEAALGRGVVNMGLNGYLGPRFLLNEVKSDLRRGDMVVVSFEYEAYFEPTPYDSVAGLGTDQAMVIKQRLRSALFLRSWSERWNVAKGVFQIAQEKLFRVLDEGLDQLWSRSRLDDRTVTMLEQIERRDAVNKYGDLTSHLNVDWSFEYHDGPDLATKTFSQPLLGLLMAFFEDMQAKGVTVVLAPPPAPRDWYDSNRTKVEDGFSRIAAALGPGVLLTSPVEFVAPRELFFDNANHVNGAGRAWRTRTLVERLRPLILGDHSALSHSSEL